MATPEEKERLAQVRSRHETASQEWRMYADGEQTHLSVPAMDGEGFDRIATFSELSGGPDRIFIFNAHADIGFLLQLLGRCAAEVRELRRQLPKPKDYAAECAMKCGDRLFRQFLIERHQLQDAGDTERVKTRVRSILAIQSMKELNEDQAAAGRWRRFVDAFDSWRKARGRING